MQSSLLNGAITGSKPAALQSQRHRPAASRRLLRQRVASCSTDTGGLEGRSAAVPATAGSAPDVVGNVPSAADNRATPQPAVDAPAPPGSSPSADAAGSSGSQSRPATSDSSTSGSGAPSRPAAAAAAQSNQRRRRPPLRLQAFLEIEDGPPRVMSPFDLPLGLDPSSPDPASRQHLPLLLYLPGIDGSGLAASRQFPSLLRRFDMQALVTPPQASWDSRGRLSDAWCG